MFLGLKSSEAPPTFSNSSINEKSEVFDDSIVEYLAKLKDRDFFSALLLMGLFL